MTANRKLLWLARAAPYIEAGGGATALSMGAWQTHEWTDTLAGSDFHLSLIAFLSMLLAVWLVQSLALSILHPIVSGAKKRFLYLVVSSICLIVYECSS